MTKENKDKSIKTQSKRLTEMKQSHITHKQLGGGKIPTEPGRYCGGR